MAGLLEKLRVGVLSTAHGVLDKVIDLNSIGAVKQYIRDVESELEKLRYSAAEAIAYTRSVERDLQQTQAQIAELDRNIDFVLSDSDQSNDHLAKPMEARLIGLESQEHVHREESASANQTASQLQEVVSSLAAKREEMVQQLRTLEALDRSARAKERVATTVDRVKSLTTTGADASIDSVADRIRRRADIADVRFEQAVDTLNTGFEKDVKLAEAEARLAARKARLAGNNPPEPPTP